MKILVLAIASLTAMGCEAQKSETPSILDRGAGDLHGDGSVSDQDTDGPQAMIRGRFESAGPVKSCGEIVDTTGPDGLLLRPKMNTCGDDIAALASTIVANLDHAAQRGKRVLLVIGQGINLPQSWLARCKTYRLDDPRFSGELCLPWDANYLADLRRALVETIGPAVAGHAALAGVYFTITTMTNGAEFHFRVAKSAFPYPGDATFRGAYEKVMDLFQQAFSVPVVFEAGHCPFSDSPDCEAPLALYRYTRDTYGKAKAGIALWNCAERFWAGQGAGMDTFGVKTLIEEATSDGVSIGCQTVGSFTRGACRFSSNEVGSYGDRAGLTGDNCDEADPTFDPEGACVDTLNWFTGASQKHGSSVTIRGTWGELWSRDLATDGVYHTSAACRAAVDRLSLP